MQTSCLIIYCFLSVAHLGLIWSSQSGQSAPDCEIISVLLFTWGRIATIKLTLLSPRWACHNELSDSSGITIYNSMSSTFKCIFPLDMEKWIISLMKTSEILALISNTNLNVGLLWSFAWKFVKLCVSLSCETLGKYTTKTPHLPVSEQNTLLWMQRRGEKLDVPYGKYCLWLDLEIIMTNRPYK